VTYLDTNIVIYAVENPVVFGTKALTRLQQGLGSGERFAVSELTRLECCSYPLRKADFVLLRLYDGFFLRPDISILPFGTNVFRRATVIKAAHGFGTVDSLHLAVAVECGCQVFLTHDLRLATFPDLLVEAL
jgi:predicted nucleic acid-binding protein